MPDAYTNPEIQIFAPVHECVYVISCEVLDAEHLVYSVYPLIDPAPHFSGKTFKDKVVLIAGGSTGIGFTTASFYAQAGAKVLILARRVDALERAKKDIEKDVKGAQVLTQSGDIVDPDVSKRAVKAVVDAWGRLDIVIANQFGVLKGPINSVSRFSCTGIGSQLMATRRACR